MAAYLLVVEATDGLRLHSIIEADSMGQAMEIGRDKRNYESTDPANERWCVFHGCEVRYDPLDPGLP